MEFLEHLDLSYNNFLSMPFDSMNSPSCHNLSLGNPPYQCRNSSALHYLDLSGNENLIIRNLQWLSRISSLKYIDLGDINLHMESNWLQLVTMLPSLSQLHLVRCQLENVSPSLQYANFTALEVLDLSDNAFNSELPNWLFNLTCDIFEIYLQNNLFRGQLSKMSLNLRVLNVLDLSRNQLNGSISNWLGQLEHLWHLDVSENFFFGPLPTNLGNLSSLVGLDVESNLLTGIVSEENFAKLSNLKYLFVESLGIIFDFNFHWIPPFQLNCVYLGPVGPKIFQWIYTQTKLTGMAIVNSKISFEAGDKFWSFVSRIEFLHLQNNSIDGDISNVLLNSTFIYLDSNNLKGGLPRLSSNVLVFVVDHNSLSGSIFPFLCHNNVNERSKLMYLDMSYNHLSGRLPNCWMNWKSLVHINLGNNNLTGKIPPSMGLLANLTSLHLHENNFFGDISSLQNCHSLSILNVRENNFSGNIPNWIPHGAGALQLRSNQFIGNIPPQICQMPSLTILDFADNRISGHVPNCLNNITALAFNAPLISKLGYVFYFDGEPYFLSDDFLLLTKGQGSSYYASNLVLMRMVDLSSNDLIGTIPLQMFSLIELYSLNLSHNKLTGRIPKDIGNMRQLESLDLSRNQLSGEIPESISNLSFLSYLNLSFNDFTGKIPPGIQLQSFNVLSYIGNANLCGPPLPKNCSHDGIFHGTKALNEDDDESQFWSCLYMDYGAGFATGFWVVCATIFFNRKWRIAYFGFLYDLRDRTYVMVVTKINSSR